MWCFSLAYLIIDLPSLENLTLHSLHVSVTFKKLHPYLRRISLYSDEVCDTSSDETYDAIKIIASSSKLQYLRFGGQMCKVLIEYSNRILKSSLAFNYLQELYLTELDLGDSEVSCFAYVMLQKCPFIKSLKLSFTPSTVEHTSGFNYHGDCKLGYLVKVEIEGIRGSSLELNLIEYVLSISVVLKEMLLKFTNTTSEANVSRELLRLPRASPEAKLICL